MENSLSIFLSSGVIAAVIGGLVTVISNSKKLQVDNITNERAKWRDDLRRYAEELKKSSDNDVEIGIVLTNIKTRINTLGVSDFKNYSKDGHIWETIGNIEKTKNDVFLNNKNTHIEELVMCLSALLKNDWDRSKQEVIGNMNRVYIFLVSLIFMVAECIYIATSYSGYSEYFIIFLSVVSFFTMAIFFDKAIINNVSTMFCCRLDTKIKRIITYIIPIILFILCPCFKCGLCLPIVLIMRFVYFSIVFILFMLDYFENKEKIDEYNENIKNIKGKCQNRQRWNNCQQK